MTQPPKGSFRGTPSSVTSARPAPDGAMALSDNPCVVGLAAELEVRRNRDTAGTVRNASSSRMERSSTCGSRRTTEKAASAAAGGSRAAVTTISDRIWGGVGGGISCGIYGSITPRTAKVQAASR